MGSDRFSRIVWIAVTLCTALIALEFAASFRVALDDPRNDARLAPAAAMLRGVPLYSAHGEGPLLDMIYGPVAAWTWIPAAAQSTPTRAITVGLAETLLLVLLPIAWLVRTETRHDAALFASVMLLAAAFLLSTPVLTAFGFRPDVPALAFSTLALGCAWTDRRRAQPAYQWAGAAFVILALGTKQVVLPLLFVYVGWIALASGRLAAARAVRALVVTGAIALAIVWLTFDVEAMLFATVFGLSHQPWVRPNSIDALWWAAGDMAVRAAPAIVMLAIAAMLVWRKGRSFAEFARSNRWFFPLAVGFICIPTALLGRAKFGGAPNTLACSIWFIWIAMLAAYATAAHRRPIVRRSLTMVALLSACALAVRAAPKVKSLPAMLRQRPAPSVAFDAARQAPGRIYFPYRPMVAIMADGRADHTSAGVFFRNLSGRHVDSQYLRSFLPPALERIAEDRSTYPEVLDFLPEFRRQILDPSLPGWMVLTRGDLFAPGEHPASSDAKYRERQMLPTTVRTWPDVQAGMVSADVRIPARGLRYLVRLDAVVHEVTPQLSLEVEVLLHNASGEHLLTLVADAAPDAAGKVSVAWPVFNEFVWSAERAIAFVSGGRAADGSEPWRVPRQHVRSRVQLP